MEAKLKELQEEALKAIAASESVKELNVIRVAYLGKKGPITEVLKGMGKLSAEERPKMGALVNVIRDEITSHIEEKQTMLEEAEVQKKIASETIDITLPGRPVAVGNHHSLTRVIEEVEDLFIGMGYTVEEGPEVEVDYYNFEALNLPKNHPARDMQDSFYITEDRL